MSANPSPTTERFDQSRKAAAGKADALAAECYCDYYGVEAADVYSVESLTDSEHVVGEGYEVHQVLDYAGLDAVVDCGDRKVDIAQRIRPASRRQVDLSLRVETGVEGRTPELRKWQNAYEDHGFVPSVVAFGVHDYVIDVLQTFALIETESILDALADGSLSGERHETGDGTAALYLPLDELRAHANVLAEWEGVVGDGGDSR